MAWGTNKFTKKLLRPNALNNNELADFISRVPDNEELVINVNFLTRTYQLVNWTSLNRKTSGNCLRKMQRKLKPRNDHPEIMTSYNQRIQIFQFYCHFSQSFNYFSFNNKEFYIYSIQKRRNYSMCTL